MQNTSPTQKTQEFEEIPGEQPADREIRYARWKQQQLANRKYRTRPKALVNQNKGRVVAVTIVSRSS